MRFIAALFVAQLLASVSAITNCTYIDQNRGTSYDINSLFRPTNGYRVLDAHYVDTSYEFNICGPVPSVPLECSNKATSPFPEAYQIEDNTCHVLSSGETSPLIDLFDPNNPSKGLMITHSQGDYCHDTRRSFTIFLPCSPDATASVEQQRISEDACSYTITIPTRAACPLECPISPSSGICGGNGFCGYDAAAKRSRCFCHSGYVGDNCLPYEAESTKLSTGEAVLVTCIVVLGILVLLGLGFLWYISKLRVSKDVPMAQINPDDAETVFSAN